MIPKGKFNSFRWWDNPINRVFVWVAIAFVVIFIAAFIFDFAQK